MMDAAIHVFLSYVRVEKGLAHNTILAYGRDLKRFDAFLSERHKQRVEQVNREDIIDFLSSLYRGKLDSRSVARYLVSLRCFYKFAMLESLVSQDPTENLESPKIRQSLPTYLRIDEIDRGLAAPDVATPIGLRDRAMLELLYSSGLRVSELFIQRFSDLDNRVGCLRCVGKR